MTTQEMLREPVAPLRFKPASEPWEFEQIHRLNYDTFVEEIPQHEPNASRTMVDRFDHENTYIICLRGRSLLGMVAVRGRRPFSLDQKLPNLSSCLPEGRRGCEIRLLSVKPPHRNGIVFMGLLAQLWQHCQRQGYEFAVISGTVRRLGLYQHLGFRPFGPLLGPPNAQFQPMYMTVEAFEEVAKTIRPILSMLSSSREQANFSTGPVGISRDVQQALYEPLMSHRSEAFRAMFHRVRDRLCQLVGSRHVEIFQGSGTLANDVIAAQLSLRTSMGLILSNGEFGERLVDHATRWGLAFQLYRGEWGKPIDYQNVRRLLGCHPEVEWIWGVHCETSSGILNNLPILRQLCSERSIKLCMDCVSSIGTVPIDLSGVYLASGASGKGLGALPGLSMVFYNHEVSSAPKELPRYLDLGLYAETAGTPFTIASNLVGALEAALRRFSTDKVFHDVTVFSVWLRSELRNMGARLIAPDDHASPVVMTVELPATISSRDLGSELDEAGYSLGYMSDYLLQRNWIQICLMGQCSKEAATRLLHRLRERYEPSRALLVNHASRH